MRVSIRNTATYAPRFVQKLSGNREKGLTVAESCMYSRNIGVSMPNTANDDELKDRAEAAEKVYRSTVKRGFAELT